MYPPLPAKLVISCSPLKMCTKASKEDALFRQLLQDVVDFISFLEAPILKEFLQDALDYLSDLDAERNSLGVDDVIKKEQILEKAAELGLRPNVDEPYEPEELEPVKEECTSDRNPESRPTLAHQPSRDYVSVDDDDADADYEVEEEASVGGNFDEKSIQSTQSVQLDSDALDFNTVLMMGDKIGALSERAGAMSMFKTVQLKAIIYELHLCLYKDENSHHKVVPLLGAEVNFDTKKDTKFSIITAKNKILDFKAKTKADREEWRDAIELAAMGRKPVQEEEDELIYGDPDDYEFDDYGDGAAYDVPSDEEPPESPLAKRGIQGETLAEATNIPEYGGSEAFNEPRTIPEYGGSEAFNDQRAIPEYGGSEVFNEHIPEYGGSEDAFIEPGDEPHYKTPRNVINRQTDSFDEEFPINPPPPRPKGAPPPPPPPPKAKPTGAKPAPPLSFSRTVPPSSAKPAKAQSMPPKPKQSPPVSPTKSQRSSGNFDDELQKALTLRKISLTKQASVVEKVAERMAEKAAEGMTVAKARPKEPQQDTDFQAAMRRRKEMAERKQREDQPVANINARAPKPAVPSQTFGPPAAIRQPAAAGPAWRTQLKPAELGSRPVVHCQPGPGAGGHVRPHRPGKPQSFGVQPGPRPAGAIPFVAGKSATTLGGIRHPAVGGFRSPAVTVVGGFKAATVVGVKPVKPPKPPHVTLNAANLASFQKKLELTKWQKPINSGKNADDEDSDDWSD